MSAQLALTALDRRVLSQLCPATWNSRASSYLAADAARRGATG